MITIKVGDAWVNISAKDTELTKGLADAQSKVEKAMNDISAKMANVGKVMAVAGAVITAAFGLTVKAAIDFNKEVANIASLIPGSTKRVDELKSAIRDMAVTVGKDTTDLAQGAYQVISAWGDTADTVEILGIAAKAATAGVATTTDAIDLLSAVTKGYGDTSTEAVQKASDLAFQTVTLGQTTFPELAASIGKVIPLTSELGVSQEELFAVMATGTGVTGKAAEVSTQLRGIMQSLMSPTVDMTKLLKEKGYASGKAMLADLGLADSLDLIKSAAEASGMPLQKYISSIEGQTLALALTGTQADNYITKLAAMNDSVGLTDLAFKEQTEGVNAAGFAFEQAKIQIGVLTQEIGDKLLPILVPLIQKITETVGKIRDWVAENPKLAETIVKWTAGIGALMLVLGPLLMILPQLVKGVGLLSGVVTPLTATIGLAIANFVIWYEVIKEIDKILKSHRTTIKDVETAENILTEAQIKLAEKLGITVEALKEFQKIGASVSKMMGIELIPEIKETTKTLEDFLAEVNKMAGIAAIGTAISDILQPAEEAIQKIIAAYTPYEKQLAAINVRYDEAIEKIKTYITEEEELKAAIDKLNEGRKAEITLLDRGKTALEKVAEAKGELVELTKSLTDKIYEFTHTEEEVKLKAINKEYDLLIENAKEVYTNYNDLRLAIEAINTKRQEEIDKLKEVGKEKDKDIEKNKEVGDSYDDLGKKMKGAGDAADTAGKTASESWGKMTITIHKATVALSNFTKETLAAAIATIKMAFYEKWKDLGEYIDQAGKYAFLVRARYEYDLAILEDQIDTLIYGLDTYNNELKKLGGATENLATKTTGATNLMSSSWNKVTEAIKGAGTALSGWSSAIVSSGGTGWNIPSYDVGTPYVPKTSLAVVHKGEEINPPGQRSYDQRKSYTSTASINIQPGAINIVTPKFSSADGQELFRQLERQIKMRGLSFAKG